MHSNVLRGQDCVSETHVSLILKVDADKYSAHFLKGLKLMDINKVIIWRYRPDLCVGASSLPFTTRPMDLS